MLALAIFFIDFFAQAVLGINLELPVGNIRSAYERNCACSITLLAHFVASCDGKNALIHQLAYGDQIMGLLECV